MKDVELLPCPFCGYAPYSEAMDRLIVIGCHSCGYSRGFGGLLRGQESPVKVSDREYYHQHANAQAAEAWNKRDGAQTGGGAA